MRDRIEAVSRESHTALPDGNVAARRAPRDGRIGGASRDVWRDGSLEGAGRQAKQRRESVRSRRMQST